MTVRVQTTGYGAAALEALRRVVCDAKETDPMAAVTILVPNHIAGTVARRFLAQGPTDGHPGIAGIHIATLPRLAEQLAANRLAPRRPATRPVVAAAWREALSANPGVFAQVAEHPATVRALANAHRDLRDISQEALDAIRDTTGISPDLVDLHRTVANKVTRDWYDTTDLLLEAAGEVGAIVARFGALVLYQPQDLTRAESTFVKAIAEHADITVIAALTGVKRADTAVMGALEKLGIETQKQGEKPTATQVFNASDSDDEVRCVVRDVVATLMETPAHRVAILYAARTPYARLLHEHLGTAKITVNGPGTRPVNERAVARTLLEVLALVDGDVPRADLFRALSNGPARDFNGDLIPLARWERLSRSAGVVAGDDWPRRLEALAAGEQATIDDEQDSADPRQWLIESAGRSIETAGVLQQFVADLRSQLNAANTLDRWSALSTWCLDLFTTLVGEPKDLAKLPREEQYAAANVTTLLDGLGNLDEVEASPTLQALREVLDLELSATLPKVGRFGDGVLVAPISGAIGLDVDVVYVVGLSEDIYPGRLREDALLPQRAREAAGGEMPDYRERLHTRHRHLLAALACGRRSVASFPRGDLRRSSRRLPSRWLLPTLRELSGNETLAATKWQEADYKDQLVTSGSFAGELITTTDLAHEQEWRTRKAIAEQRLDDPVHASAVELIKARASDTFTRFDGNLAGAEGLPDYATSDKAISPTALESYAGCPHAFFVQRLLGVKQLEQPEDIVVISAAETGNLMHQALEALVTEFEDDLPSYGEPWTQRHRARFTEIGQAKAKEFEERGLTGHPRLWHGEEVRILSDLAWLIDDDNTWRAETNAAVRASEMAFGMQGHPPVEIALPTGGRVIMRGSADKVDEAENGTIYVTDLKTGSQRTFKDISEDDPVVGGTKLQLPVYAHAARERYGNRASHVEASYWFVRGNRGRIKVPLTPAVEEVYAETLAVIVGSIANGLFPPRAPEDPDFAWVQCDYCNPDGIGHAENRQRWLRKRSDPALAEYVGLVEAGDHT